LTACCISANGSYAFYAIDGVHDHTLPADHHSHAGIINDYTDRGILYDPTQSAYWYEWTPPATGSNVKSGIFTPYDQSYPVGYLEFLGQWGDVRYPNSDPRQHDLIGKFFKYENGPTGPADKDLGRKEVWSGSNHGIWNKLVP
jgi:hypothetical protein